MECYKLIVTEDRFGTRSSRDVLIKLLKEVYPSTDNPANYIQLIYIPTDTFPKEYYFKTLKEGIKKNIASKFKVELSKDPITLEDITSNPGKYHSFGKGDYFVLP